jgi:hypothetical protein
MLADHLAVTLVDWKVYQLAVRKVDGWTLGG